MTKVSNIIIAFFFVSCGQDKQGESVVEMTSKSSLNSSFDTTKTLQKKDTTNFLNNLKFVIDSTDEYSKTLKVYRNNQELLTHTIYKSDGDCSSINLELGSYKTKENTITFYSYWAAADRQARNLMPFGFRKQIYVHEENGKLLLKENKIYIEDYIDKTPGREKFYEDHNSTRHIGIKYLKENPITKYQSIARSDYINNIEKMYNAKFVIENDKKLLETEVRNILKVEIALNTDGWSNKEIWGESKR